MRLHLLLKIEHECRDHQQYTNNKEQLIVIYNLFMRQKIIY